MGIALLLKPNIVPESSMSQQNMRSSPTMEPGLLVLFVQRWINYRMEPPFERARVQLPKKSG